LPLPRPAHLRLAGVTAAGLALLAALAAFLLLYLRFPAGWSPVVGRAPRIGAVFEAVFPYPTVSLSPAAFRRAAIGLVVAMWALYAGAIYLMRRESGAAERRRLLALVIGSCAAMHVVLVLLPPVLSTDLYRHALFGKLILSGDSPYLLPADALKGDVLWPYAGWTHLRSHYGPTLLWLATGATALGGGGPVGTAIAFKVMVGLLNAGACYAVWALARMNDGDDGLEALALYAWNPLVLLEAPGQAHPDAIVIALGLLGVLHWWRGRPAIGVALLLASAAVTYVAGVLLALAVVKIIAETARGRRLAVGGRLLGAAALVGLGLYGPFLGSGGLFQQAGELIAGNRSFQAAAGGSAAPPPFVALVILAGGLVAALVVAARARRPYVLELSAALITFFMLFCLRLRMPWYFMTGIAFTAAGAPTTSNRALRLVTLFLGVLAMFLYGAIVSVGNS
jgi:hypothetical protein